MKFKDVRVGDVFEDKIAGDLFAHWVVTQRSGNREIHLLNGNGYTEIVPDFQWPEWVRDYRLAHRNKLVQVKVFR